MRDDLSLRRQVCRIASGPGRQLLNVVRDHALKPGHTFAAREFDNSTPVFFGERCAISRGFIGFQQHIFIIGRKIGVDCRRT